MRARYRDTFATVRSEGAILPPDLLERIADLDPDLGGLGAEDYHLSGEKIREATNRAWNRLQGAWATLRAAREALPAPDLGTTVTRERWLLPLFQELGYGRLLGAKAVEIDGRTYPVSHAWQNTPIHLVGLRVDLDRRAPGVAGAARTTPHGLLQELLNRSDERLWGFLSNGLKLRLLRDNRSLTRQAYVEFDLEAMMEGEVYADFVLFWLICHESRVEAARPEECWLERWSRTAQEQGTRALDQLRNGVEEAISALGRGFLSHPANVFLREKLRSGALLPQDYYRELLRLIYRLLFLFVAEDRELLLAPGSSPEAQERYQRFFSTSRLRRLAERRRGTRHADLYRGLILVTEKLGRDEGCPELGLPALGSFLFSAEALPHLERAEITNADLLDAVRALALTLDRSNRRLVDYRNLGSEELGSVYEALLELHPKLNVDAASFELATAGGHERKTTGSYYTPTSLIQSLLDSALEPLLEEALKKPDPEAALLNLKILDPACGSGHFLIAAAHRLAKRLAAIRTGDEEPSPEATRTALRDVIGRCLYGVDLNPMAVELCKVNLWLEALEPGKPLSFLEHRILCGNSLLGATPALLADGIPDQAFQPIEGDDKEVVQSLKRQNRTARAGQESLLVGTLPAVEYATIADAATEVAKAGDASIAEIHEKEEWYRLFLESAEYQHARLVADAWCAAFVWKKRKDAPPPVTHDVFLRLVRDPSSVPKVIQEEISRLSKQYRFFHWHLAFPDVFQIPGDGERPQNEQAGWSGGFDVVLGNPPWERIKLQEEEFFATRRSDISEAPNAATRRRMIAALAEEDPPLYAAFLAARRQAEAESHFVRNSGRYPLCGRGDVNTYAIFAENKRMLLGPTGHVGTIVPSGIATDDTTKFFFQDLMDGRALESLFDFENRAKLFPAVDSRMKFSLLTLTGAQAPATQGAEFAFFCHETDDLRDPERRFTLSAEDIALLNPNTRTCPVFRTRRDAEITKAIYRRVPVLIREGPPKENPWGVSFLRLFDMANDSHLFRTRAELEAEGWRLKGNVFVRDGSADSDGGGPPDGGRYLPLYEAKMIHHFDHRWATYEGLKTRDLAPAEKTDPHAVALPRYWVPAAEVNERLRGRWDREWLLGWRDICRSTDERTVIASVVPRVGVGHELPLFASLAGTPSTCAAFQANLTSFALDYVARQKIGGTHMTYFYLKQLPVLPPLLYSQPAPWSPDKTIAEWMLPRVLELVYTSWELEPFARDCGFTGPPFTWDEERRFQLRCELDAAFFHLYGIEHEDVEYIMDTFPIVKRKDQAKFGEYRTKRVILDEYHNLGWETTRERAGGE